MEAEFGFGLFMMILGLCLGVDVSCDGRQTGAQCYEALGASVTLWLMDDTSQIDKFQLRKGRKTLLVWRKNDGNKIQDRFQFFPSNGSLRINNLNRDDSGEYVSEIYDEDGGQIPGQSVHLSVEAPVSSVRLSSECLPSGQTRLSCSSEGGDSPQYSWTLDGRPLMDAELVSDGDTESNNITVATDVSGYVVCTVENHVSRVCGFLDIQCKLSNETQTSEFGGNHTVCVKPTTTTTTTTTSSVSTVEHWVIMAGVLSALVIFLILGVILIQLQKRRKNISQKAEDDDQVTYADVQVVRRHGRQPEARRAEPEVEYGQVKFSVRPPRRNEPPPEQCVYAAVRKGR